MEQPMFASSKELKKTLPTQGSAEDLHWSQEMKSIFSGLPGQRSVPDLFNGQTDQQQSVPDFHALISSSMMNNSVMNLNNSNQNIQQNSPGPIERDSSITDGPDLRDPDFIDLACALPAPFFRQLMQRDDLICNSEDDILKTIQIFLNRSV